MRKFSRLIADTQAVTAPVVAVVLPLLLLMVGGAVDVSRMFWVKNRLQGACDSAVLAGRHTVTTNGYDTASKAAATTYFNTNFDQTQQGTSSTTFTSAADTSGNQVNGVASTVLPLYFMKLFGWNQFNITATCTSTLGVGNADVTMVLDVTGSMDSQLDSSNTRISALKAAVKNFYSTIATAASGTNARIRYAFVPYSSTVNVGAILYQKDPSYIVNSWNVQSRVPIFDVTNNQKFSGWTNSVPANYANYSSSSYGSSVQYSTTAYDTQWSCTSALPATGAWTNTGSPSVSTSTVSNGSGTNYTQTDSNQSQYQRTYYCAESSGSYYIYYYDTTRAYHTYTYNTAASVASTSTSTSFDHWEYRRVTYDTSALKVYNSTSKTFASFTVPNGSNGANASYTWAGCIEERETTPSTTFSFSSIAGMSPSSATDVDIDSAPTSDTATKWAPMLTDVGYYRTNSSGNMTTSPVTAYGSSGGSYCVPAATTLSTMTQTDYNAYVDTLVANGATYLDTGMTWGARISSPDGIFGDIVNAAPTNGGDVGRHIIFMTDGQMDTANYVLQSWGIEYLDRRITTDGADATSDANHSQRFRAVCDAIKNKGIRIWVIAFTSSLNSDLSYCASASSGYTANSTTQINAAFQSIAKQVGELRVMQ